MESSPTAAIPTVLLQGHFWQANVEVVQLARPSQNYAFRSLWLERYGTEADLLYLPSTLILLSCVRQVTVAPAPSQVYRWRRDASPAPAADTAENIRNALGQGELTLLLVQANPQHWRSVDPTSNDRNQSLTCLAGDIALGTSLKPVENATERLYADLGVQSDETALFSRQGGTRLRSPLSVHSSGLSLYGRVNLPWQREALGAPLQLAQTFSPSATNPAEIKPGPFRLTLETERLTPEERQGWVNAWRQLSRYLTPRNPLNGRILNQAEAGPAWVTLEVTNPTTVPNLFWEIANWPQSPQLKFAGDSFSLIFSNQSPYAVDTPTTSLGRVSPRVSMQSRGDGSLSLMLEAGAGGIGGENYVYHYQSSAPESEDPGAEPAETHATETISLKNLNLAFDPVAVPAFLRSRQGLPTPATDADTRNTPVLWGFMPLERGWFQLPVPNLTEQIYLDNELARPISNANAPTSLIQGAVALGNDDPALLKTDYPHEQPWNLVLTNMAGLSGTWTLQHVLNKDSEPDFAGYRLSQVDLKGTAPELVFNGLFWLSTARPLAQDALPSLDNWVSGVRSHPLRTVRETDLFPAVAEVQLTKLTLQARSLPPTSPVAPKPVVAELENWSFRYGVNNQVLGQLIQAKVLPTNTFSKHLPWVWQHHGTLPMVQAIPLTQTLAPPNYPSPNRQLIPFELAVKPITADIDYQGDRSEVSFEVPADWLFTVNGARDWPQPAHILPSPDGDVFSPAREWQRLFNLPLVSLSLPGLVLDPDARNTGLAIDTTLNLHTQYRFDLPYTDEPNALTQLPEPPQLPEALSPLPTSPRPAAPQPLGRDTFEDHWQVLSQRASLASADAVVATASGSNGATLIKSLVEPFVWPAQVSLDLTTYPGSLSLANAGNTNGAALRLESEVAIAITEDAALEGISGRFRQNDTTFDVVAGSLIAAGGASGLRDQRGLTRAAAAYGELLNLIKTPVSLQLEPTEPTQYDLTTTREPVALQAGNRLWQIWFRDLPVQVSNAEFSRQHTASDAAEDVNDPNAFSHRYNVLTGYEWRLGDPSLPQQSYLPFFNLHFYPLALESAALAENKIQSLRLVGRLQLPLLAAGEAIPDLSNDIQLTFERDANDALALVAVEPAETPDSAPVGTWPLALENGETTSAPQLTWHAIRLDTNAESVPSLIVDQVWLNFFLFDTAWALPLAEPLVFPQSPVAEVTGRYEFPALALAPALDPRRASLNLRFAESSNRALELPHHSASLRVDIHLGRLAAADSTSRQSTFDATVDFPLLPRLGEATAIPTQGLPVSLFKQLNLEISALHLNHHALEFEWQQYSNAREGLYFLPGMPLKTAEIPGFAALTFAPQMSADRNQPSQDRASYPHLMLKSAFLETILTCQGGEFLQTAAPASPASADHIFDPSAVDLVVGYTTQLVDESGNWSESLLLNGFLEVKNLVSWPLDLQSLEEVEAEPPGSGPAQPPRTGVLIPALPEARDGYRQLNHLRHSLRVLFNQHSLPVGLLTLGETGLVFELKRDRTWKFLAVAEHQLVAVFMNEDQTGSLGCDRRWTTTQEIRLMPVGAFKTFLANSNAKTLGSSQGRTTLGQASLGLWNRALQAELLPDKNLPLDEAVLGSMLMVEASAPHWVRTNPVAAANPTTLQFLPNGTQLGILSNPDDYGPSDPNDPSWLLLTMPFWGRLLSPTPDLQNSTNPIQKDPVVLLSRAKPESISDLALALTNWAKDKAIFLSMSGFDTAAGRTWARLDPLSLEESWFRLNHPLPEVSPAQLQSVLAALPGNSARISRSTALDYAFNSLRLQYPPGTPPTGLSEPDSIEEEIAASLLIYSERSRFLRIDRGLQALYTFEGENSQGQIEDVSGVGSPLNLMIDNRKRVEWLSGGGLKINDATLIQSKEPALKIIQACRTTNELTIEAWIKPKQTQSQGPARIVTLSQDTGNRYFTLGHGKDGNQAASQYIMRLQVKDVTTSNGLLNRNQAPPIETPPNSVRTELTHLVFTRDQKGVMKFYIDGQEIASNTLKNDLFPKRSNSNFDQTFRFALANELTKDRPWLGEYYLIAIYNQALSLEEIESLRLGGLKRQRQQPPYSWHQTALQLKTSGLLLSTEQMEQSTEMLRHAAATLLPVRLQVNGQANPRPLSLSVSPYLGLEFQSAPVNASAIQLASVELLCLEARSGLEAKSVGLRPVASSLIDRELLSKSQTSLNEVGQKWATETHRRLAPESPIAVLRYREILSNGNQDVVTRYRFQVLTVPQANNLAKPVFALRSQVRHARFQSGQFGGSQMPFAPRLFELAPPQTVGVQPLYLNQRPPVADDQEPPVWPWGLSGLRVSVQYSDRNQPALDLTSSPTTLWWQAPHYAVQYRANEPTSSDDAEKPTLPTAGLPPYYRPGAIKTLLPVLPSLPMPDIEKLKGLADGWQPILPGQLRYLLTGDRPGVMMVIRNQLLKQTLLDSEDPTPLLVSGSVPVQHRVPRPVALPSNNNTDYALQPWASYFEPQHNLLATPTPADEAFFAECGGRPAQRLQLQIQSPLTGTISSTWDGKLSFSNVSNLGGWRIQLRLVVDNLQTFSYPDYESPQPTGKIDFDLTGENISSRLQDALVSRAAGDVVQVIARVKPYAATDDFWQTLTFPLRVIDPEALPLPLRPTFVQFEDPEYNRQLVSNAATATVSVLEQRANFQENVTYDITLACDRREYNPQGTLLLRYDWSDNRSDFEGILSLSRVNAAGIVRPLRWPLDNMPSVERRDQIRSRNLVSLSLVDLQTVNKITLSQGDVLELTLTLTVKGQREPSTIVLPVRIVNSPVIPVPQAAYGLLRSMVQSQDERAIVPTPPACVECTRFAWGPAASRIELICAEDLRTGIVRRRAVFQWSDTVRPSPNPGWQYQYAVQKITQTGSTHLPKSVPISSITTDPQVGSPN